MDIFEGEFSCYKFQLAETEINQQYNISIFCHVDDVEFEHLIEVGGLKSVQNETSHMLTLPNYKADFRTAFKHAQFIIDKAILGSLILKQQ